MMDKHEREELDAHITGQYEDAESNELEANCKHAYISWHGSTGECQECGRLEHAVNPETDAILTKLFDQWRDDILRGPE